MKILEIWRTPGNECTISDVILSEPLEGTGVPIPSRTLQTYKGIEQPWRDNAPFESCIPSGGYVLLPFTGAKYKNVWAFHGGTVSIHASDRDRYSCLIHSANYASQLSGCLAIGQSAGFTKKGKNAVWNSRAAIEDLRSRTKDDPFIVCEVRWKEDATKK